MAFEIILPKLGFSMEEGRIVSWLCADGAQISEGDALYEVESDKSVQEVEAPASGTLKIFAEPDQTYPVGTVLGEIA